VQTKDRFTLGSCRFHAFYGIDVGFRVINNKFLSALLFYLVHIGVLGSHRLGDHLFYDFLHTSLLPTPRTGVPVRET